jgi:hypothetical protein
MDVVEVRYLGGHRLWLRFEDGASGELDFKERMRFHGVFEALRDPERFAEVSVDAESGTVCWPTGADLDPDVLHAAIHGVDLLAD